MSRNAAGRLQIQGVIKIDEKHQGKMSSYEYLRAFSCIGIIFIHVLYSALVLFGQNMSLYAMAAGQCLFNCFMWCVPCFLMITGAFLLDGKKKITYEKLFKRYLSRVVGAIFLFGFLYTVLEVFFNGGENQGREFLEGIYQVFAGKSWSHLWYLYSLAGIYLLFPFYKKITQASAEKELRYLLVISVVFLSVLPALKAAGVECGFYIPVSTIYPFYLFLGWYLRNWGPERVGPGVVLMAAGTLGVAVSVWMRWVYQYQVLETFYTYSSIYVILQAAGIYIIFTRSKAVWNAVLHRILYKIAEHSFGIYLIHLVYVRGIYKHLKFNPFQFRGGVGIVGMLAVTLVLSYATDVLLRKVPLFRSVL